MLADVLDTAPLKEKALYWCDRLRRGNLNKPLDRSFTKYDKEHNNNYVVKMAATLYIALSEYNEAVGYVKEHYIANDKETRLYAVLDCLYRYDLPDIWVQEYENAVQQGIKPRQYLVNNYKEMKEELKGD